MKKIISIITLSLYSLTSYGFIDVESIRRDGEGINGSTEVKLSGASGNTNKVSTSLSSYLGHKKGKMQYLGVVEYNYSESSNVKDSNNGSVHVRAIRKLYSKLSGELFIQREFNDFKDISSRTLYGAGVRAPLMVKVETTIFGGAGAYYELEKLNSALSHNIVRANIYLSVVSSFKTFKLSFTSYFNPSLKDFEDYRIQQNLSLEFEMSKKLSFVAQASLAYDSQSPVGIEKNDFNYMTGIRYKY